MEGSSSSLSLFCLRGLTASHGPLAYHSLRQKGSGAPGICQTLWIVRRLSFAHKTGQMPQNSINVSCKSDNQIAWISITGSQDK